MEGKKSKPRALLVFGAPCSGKTTFAMKFANKFNLAYYDLDDIAKKNKFSRENILAILELLTHTRQTVIIEGGLDTEKQRQEVKNIFIVAGYVVDLLWIQTDIATIRNRMKFRYKSVAKAKSAYDESIGKLEAPSELERPIILSGKHTFETQTKHAVAGLADAHNKWSWIWRSKS